MEIILLFPRTSAEEAEKRINSQMSNDERRARSQLVGDHVLPIFLSVCLAWNGHRILKRTLSLMVQVIDSSGTIDETAAKLKTAVRDLAVRVKENHGFELVINEDEV